MICAICIAIPLWLVIAAGEWLVRRYPAQADKLCDRVFGEWMAGELGDETTAGRYQKGE